MIEAVSDRDVGVEQRRDMLVSLFQALPRYASREFWQAVAIPEMPLEVIVRCLRHAEARADLAGRDRLLEIIIKRTQTANEAWAKRIARSAMSYGMHDIQAIAADIYADLCERVVRALLDTRRLFWEENFVHCLYYERRHVYAAWSVREGLQKAPCVSNGMRVPRMLVSSLEGLVDRATTKNEVIDVEDVRAQRHLADCETSDLLWYVCRLPSECKAVVLLYFWEGYAVRETAQLLGVTERTIRNRLRKACELLRCVLVDQGGGM
jgi:RNA polymerase sigma factor (sigma-70 family)